LISSKAGEFLLRSAIYCLEEWVKTETARIRLRISAKLVPRWGVARKTMADVDEIIFL